VAAEAHQLTGNDAGAASPGSLTIARTPAKAGFDDNTGFHRHSRTFTGFSRAKKPVNAGAMPGKARAPPARGPTAPSR
jgi:hypothetical protein